MKEETLPLITLQVLRLIETAVSNLYTQIRQPIRNAKNSRNMQPTKTKA